MDDLIFSLECKKKEIPWCRSVVFVLHTRAMPKPAEAASRFPNTTRKGRDGQLYESRRNAKTGRFRWVPAQVVHAQARASRTSVRGPEPKLDPEINPVINPARKKTPFGRLVLSGV